MKINVQIIWVICLFLAMCTGYTAGVYADEPLCMNSTTGQSDDLKQQAQQNQGGGTDIVQSIFTAVNGIMNDLAKKFYTSIVQNTNYRNAITAAVLMYIVVYGIMITLNIASYKTGEIINRIAKIAIVFAVMTDGWGFFSKYVGDPAINGMNQLISQFAQAGQIGVVKAVDTTQGGKLSPVSMQMLFGSMSLMFSIRFIVIILTLITTGAFGWFYAFVLIWALIEFILMLIGAIVTYIKAIVGLAFLFGLAPIFFGFILFEKTRQVFQGWLNQVLGFVLQPVLLFAFLGFYGTLLTKVLIDLMYPVGIDFCWQKFIPLGIIDIYWWRAVEQGQSGVGGDWDVSKTPPVQLLNILYFLLLVHLGKNLSKFIEQLSRDLSGGSGPGIVRGATVGQWFANQLSGGVGIGGVAMGVVKSTANPLKNSELLVGARKAIDGIVKSGGNKDTAAAEPVGGAGYSDGGTGVGSDTSGTEKFIDKTTLTGKSLEGYIRGNDANNIVPFNNAGGGASEGGSDGSGGSSVPRGGPGGGGGGGEQAAVQGLQAGLDRIENNVGTITDNSTGKTYNMGEAPQGLKDEASRQLQGAIDTINNGGKAEEGYLERAENASSSGNATTGETANSGGKEGYLDVAEKSSSSGNTTTKETANTGAKESYMDRSSGTGALGTDKVGSNAGTSQATTDKK